MGGLAASAFVTLAVAVAQECPQPSATGPTVRSEVQTLEGTLVFHDSIRKWFELKLNQSQCGNTSIELVPANTDDWTPLEVLRSCAVKSTGEIDIPATGYYSLNLYQAVNHIEPVGDCVQKPPFPDYSNLKPDKSVLEYRVEMSLNYRPGDHPIIFRVWSAGTELRPWQAYASYMLTGGFVLYGYCGDGFVVDKVYGTPQAKPSQFDDNAAAFDPESAAALGKKDLLLKYTCVRENANE